MPTGEGYGVIRQNRCATNNPLNRLHRGSLSCRGLPYDAQPDSVLQLEERAF